LNPGFESGAGTAIATNWVLSAGDTFREQASAFGYTDGPFPEGDFALKQFGGNGDAVQTNIPVYERFRYMLRGSFYHSSSEDTPTNSPLSTRMFMHVEWFSQGGASLRNDYTANHNGASPADLWTTLVSQVISPPGAAYADFHVESDSDISGGSVFGDAFFFGPANLLLNASLEAGSSQTNAPFWSFSPGDASRETTNVFGYTDGALPHESYALKQFGGNAEIAQSGIPVAEGVPYAAQGWFYHSDIEDIIANSLLSTRMFMHVEWLDAQGGSLRNDFSGNHNGTSPADTWSQIVMHVTSPSNAAHAVFRVSTDSDVGGGSVFGDDFYFAQEEPVVTTNPPAGLLIIID